MNVDTDIAAGTDLLGKSITDLQSNVAIGDDGITGTLLYVSDYTGFSGDVSLQSGNYLVLHIDAPADATVKVKLTNEVTLDEDRIVILRIADKSSQTVRVVVSKPGAESVIKEYSLTGLTCNES